jgi:hypothetical protein
MKKFLVKLFIFLLPIFAFILYSGYEILVLPVDYYTFRAWEALRVYENTKILTGPFYPNYFLEKTELGDLSGLTKIPVPKHVVWYTDKYGFRKKETNTKTYDIVVVGDSAIAGTGLTQNNIYTEKLENKLKKSVYPYAPANFNQYLIEDRFLKNPPKIVIFESAEKLVLHIPEILSENQRLEKYSFRKTNLENVFLSNNIVLDGAIMADRLKKRAFVNYIYARLAELPKIIFGGGSFSHKVGKNIEFDIPEGQPEMIFYSEPEDYFKKWQDNHINRVVMVLKGYRDKLLETNTRFIFMPIPNKENIYWNKVNGGKENDNLKRLIIAAKSQGIETIDLLSIYEKLHFQNESELLYQLDDSHWNSYGVEVAVNQTIRKFEEIGLIN